MKFIKFLFTKEALRDVYAHATKWQVFKFKIRRFATIVARILFICASGALFTALGAFFFSTSTTSVSFAAPLVLEASSSISEAPIMIRIADCESGTGKVGSAHQFNKDGSVVMHVNTNGTTDVGEWQINMNASNLAIMAKQGFNPLTQAGNQAMAEYLYANVGTSPWSSSSACWNR